MFIRLKGSYIHIFSVCIELYCIYNLEKQDMNYSYYLLNIENLLLIIVVV